jgi:hypothetical protein
VFALGRAVFGAQAQRRETQVAALLGRLVTICETATRGSERMLAAGETEDHRARDDGDDG